ncbi:hypothetical protein D9M73_51630 [compost metagenome]|uniref:DUF1173 family protein n=1 Tax=Polaromonas aquatica TaxID=332657 RepID=A0ABW1TTW5_9BURK
MASATLSNITVAQSKSVHILVSSEHFDLKRLSDPSQAERFQEALDEARHKFGHALCMCRPTPLKLQVRLRDGKYHLAVWPEQGSMHDSSCIFFREDEAGPETEIATQVKENEDGSREIRLTFTLDRSSVASTPRPQTASRLSVDDHKQSEQASLRGLLHLLWAEANLTRWHPSWERDWGRARYELFQAAKHLTIKGATLGERLYVPRPYRESMQDEINREWDRFNRSLTRGQVEIIKSGLIVAPVRKFVELPAQESGKTAAFMHLRHMRTPIGLNDATYSFLQNQCKTAVRRVFVNAQENERAKEPRPAGWIHLPQPEVIAIAHVEANTRGGIWARGVWLMSVHPRVFIPAGNTDDILLIDALMRDGHQFSRLLTSQQPMARTRPEWTLRHVYDPQGIPVPRAALEILSNGAMPEFVSKRAELADALATKGIPVWTWTPLGRQLDRVVPPLPPPERVQKSIALQTLCAMASAPGTFYAYGSRNESQINH